MVSEEIITKLYEFLDNKYAGELERAAQIEEALIIDFNVFDRHDPISADMLLENPDEILEGFEEAAKQIIQDTDVNIRIKNLPERRDIRVRNLRSKHMNRLWTIDCVIKSATEVKPQIYEAVFQCPECDTKLVVPQDTNLIQKPALCGEPFAEKGCGRRGDFDLIAKKMFDVRWLSGVEPFEVTEGDQPGEIAIVLKEDLTTPKMQRKTDPGARLKIVGTLKEVPKRIKGKLSTKLDMMIEANYIEPAEMEFDDTEISEKDVQQIKKLAADPKIYDKLVASFAPGIYGFKEIKEAIIMQLFGGTVHKLADGSRIRGNIHILLTGDPGVGKSLIGSSKVLHNSDENPEFTDIGKMVDDAIKKGLVARINDAEVCFENNSGIKVASINPETHKLDWKSVSAFIRHKSPKLLLKVKTKSGREVVATKDHSFVRLDADGDIISVTGEELKKKCFLPVPLGVHKTLVKEIETGPQIKRTSSKLLPKKIPLDWDFGFFMGMFLAEGSNPGNKYVSISSMNKERRNLIKKFAESIGLNPRENDEGVLIHSRRLVEFMKPHCYATEKICFGKGSGAIRKRIPDFCFFAPTKFIRGLLSGLFSGDGYFLNAKPLKGRTKGNLKVELTTISPHLADGLIEILSLMEVFSITRKKYYTYKGEKRVKYEITTLGNNAKKLLEKIEMIGKPKPTIDRFSEKDTLDSLPCTGLLYDIVRELGYSKRQHDDADKRRAFTAMMRTVRSKGKIGRRRLEKISEMLLKEANIQKNEKAKANVHKLLKILKSNVIWDEVISIEKMPSTEKYVYDLAIDGNETFVANNLVVHNSMLLKYMTDIMPRAKYVSGSGVTGAGLTASVRKDEIMGGWLLEAGALILTNKSVISIDEFDKMGKDDQIAMHEAMSVESYHGNTLITLSNGEMVRIKDLVEKYMKKNKNNIKKGHECIFAEVKGPEILTTDFKDIGKRKISRVSKHKAPEHFYRITLQNGRDVTVTPQHPCFVFNIDKFETTPVDKLKVGDFVPIPKVIPIEGREQKIHIKNDIRSNYYNAKHIRVPITVSNDMSKFTGYMISEGSHEINRGKVTGAIFTNTNETLLRDFRNTTKNLFNLEPYNQRRNGKAPMLRYISMELKNFLNEMEPGILKNHYQKKIPDIFFKSKKQYISKLLRALYDGDGGISQSTITDKIHNFSVVYTTASDTLASQIHELLLRFGILSKITIGKSITNRTIYRVVIVGPGNLKRFVENVGFSSKKKNEFITTRIKLNKIQRHYSETLPIGNLMKKTLRTLKLSQKPVFGYSLTMYGNKFNFTTNKIKSVIGVMEKRLIEIKSAKTGLLKINTLKGVRKLRERIGISISEIAKKIGCYHQLVSLRELHKPTEIFLQKEKEALDKTLNEMIHAEKNINTMRSLAFGDITLCKIKNIQKIKNCGEKWSYDVSVPGEVFISHGMVLHNTISIAKASIVATLPAQTAVLAGANPKLGRFDPYAPIVDQIQIPETLLSRFDLKFALRDRPDKNLDERLADHITMSRVTPESVEPEIELDILKKYIAYAKQNIKDIELTQEAADEMKRFYVEMRNPAGESDQTVSITLRQYEALLRLAEASAKVRLSNKITTEDVERSIRLMKYSLAQLGFDYETGKFDIDKMESGVTTSRRNKIRAVTEIIETLQKQGDEMSIEDIKASAEEQGIDNIDEIIDKLRQQGAIFEPRPGYIRKV